jgi:hypothetical protein
VLDPILKSKAAPIKGQSSTKKYVSFSARNKTCTSPLIAPTSAPPSPPLQSLQVEALPAHSRAKAAGDNESAGATFWTAQKHAAGREMGEKQAQQGAAERVARGRGQAWLGCASWTGAMSGLQRGESSSPPPLRRADQDEDSSAADAMLLIASSALAFAHA